MEPFDFNTAATFDNRPIASEHGPLILFGRQLRTTAGFAWLLIPEGAIDAAIQVHLVSNAADPIAYGGLSEWHSRTFRSRRAAESFFEIAARRWDKHAEACRAQWEAETKTLRGRLNSQRRQSHGGAAPKLTPEQAHQALHMAAAGKSDEAIAAHFGVSRAAIYKRRKQAGL